MIINRKLIISNWLKYFFQINFILFILIFAANTISSLLRSNVTTSEIALNQLFTMPDILLKTIPVSCLLTSIILVSRFIKTSELTAMYSIGFSPVDFSLLVLKLSIATSFAVFIIAGFIQPRLMLLKSSKYTFLESKFRKLKKQGLISSKISNGKMWYRSGKTFFNYSTYNNQNNELKNIEIFSLGDNDLSKAILSKSLMNSNKDTWTGSNILQKIGRAHV